MELGDLVRKHCLRLQAALDGVRGAALERVAEALDRARREHNAIFVFGNGGSAATALHFAADLNGHASCGPRRFRALALTGNASAVTAAANDGGYESVFVRQLENLAGPGDVAVGISASGNSPNVVAALRHARGAGLVTVALLGSDGGAAQTHADHTLLVSARSYGVVEDGHGVLCHILVSCLGGGPQAIPRAKPASVAR